MAKATADGELAAGVVNGEEAGDDDSMTMEQLKAELISLREENAALRTELEEEMEGSEQLEDRLEKTMAELEEAQNANEKLLANSGDAVSAEKEHNDDLFEALRDQEAEILQLTTQLVDVKKLLHEAEGGDADADEEDEDDAPRKGGIVIPSSYNVKKTKLQVADEKVNDLEIEIESLQCEVEEKQEELDAALQEIETLKAAAATNPTEAAPAATDCQTCRAAAAAMQGQVGRGRVKTVSHWTEMREMERQKLRLAGEVFELTMAAEHIRRSGPPSRTHSPSGSKGELARATNTGSPSSPINAG